MSIVERIRNDQINAREIAAVKENQNRVKTRLQTTNGGVNWSGVV